MYTPLLALVLLVISYAPLVAEKPLPLVNDCRPMELVLASLDNDEAAIGIKKRDLQSTAESRLRAARLYTSDFAKAGLASLYVKVRVVGSTFVVIVQYRKWVTDEFGASGTTTT